MRPHRLSSPGARRPLVWVVAFLLASLLLALPPRVEAVRVVGAEVASERFVFDSGRMLNARVRVAGAGRHTVRIWIIRRDSGRIVKGFARKVRLPRRGGIRNLRQSWAGRTWSGAVAPAGNYVVRVSLGQKTTRGGGRPGGSSASHGSGRRIGRFEFRTHLAPVTGLTGRRGPVGEFGAGRNGGRVHEGLDILAPCGRRLVASRGGRVSRVGYDPVLYGHFLEIRGRAEPYSYFYSHLIAPPPFSQGRRIRAGAFVGRVGQTGNAATTPCHLHFEIHRRGRPIDPAPFLRDWAG